jgi:hypothetical protein
VSADDVQPVRHLTPTGDADEIISRGVELQHMASGHGLHNVFSDNGYQELVLLVLFGLRKLRREGNDAADDEGHQYELKTVNRINSDGVAKRSLSVTTEHTLTLANIERYRAAHLWIIAVFNQSLPECIYEITPAALEPYFRQWEAKLRDQDPDGSDPLNHINNPKIPIGFVAQNGARVWPPEPTPLPTRAAEDARE